MKTDPYSFGALVGQRADIYVFLIAAPFHKLRGQFAELISRVGKIYLQDAAAPKHSPIVVLDSEKAESLVLVIPVTADAFKARGAVVEGMGQDSDPSFG